MVEEIAETQTSPRLEAKFRKPTLNDGQSMWRMARDSKVLDLNSSYSYLLWCRDFAETSIVATVNGDPAGFITGYVRPGEPGTLMVWQVAVNEAFRGRRLAAAMLDRLATQVDASRVETTITADNEASIRLFAGFATRRGAPFDRQPLFTRDLYPDGHDTEFLYRIGPLDGTDAIDEGSLPMTDIFETLESEVRSYSRSWPAVFERANGSSLTSEDGRTYLDFFSGAGALNYGHNNPALLQPLLEYLASGAVVHSLDMKTPAKRKFLQTFQDVILKPRNLDYKVMFPGPTGTNSVEAALKLARKVTGRQHILSFTNAFHGMTLGSLSVTGNSMKRKGAGVPLTNSSRIPYDDYFDGETADFLWLERVLADSGSGVDKPAAVIVETVQGEGGLNAARAGWLRELATLCKRHEILLIVDDVQAGCGRTGTFFSFEEAGITPDIVCLSKSISGFGLPLALTLFRPELDIWSPGEHNGTFRGHNPAFVTGTAALETYWRDGAFQKQVGQRIAQLREGLERIAASVEGASVRGRGLLSGVIFPDLETAGKIAAEAYEHGLLVETSGPESEVIKLMPALTISAEDLDRGLDILMDAARAATEVRELAGAL